MTLQTQHARIFWQYIQTTIDIGKENDLKARTYKLRKSLSRFMKIDDKNRSKNVVIERLMLKPLFSFPQANMEQPQSKQPLTQQSLPLIAPLQLDRL